MGRQGDLRARRLLSLTPSLHVSLSLLLALAVLTNANRAPAQSLQSQEEAAVRAAVDRVNDSVVQIRTVGGLAEFDSTLLPDGPTTGVVISPDGYILSSSFNFIQPPASILVTFANGEQAPATLVAKDHSRMLVLLKAQGVDNLKVAEPVPLDEIRVGQWAIAVGRTFRNDRTNVSVGIVSALDRMYGKVIQTDADVSAANYGGPLVDIRGRVFGVVVPIAPQTTSEVAGAEWYDSGIGFAVPLASSDTAIERMKKGEDLHAGVLGIGMASDNAHSSPAELLAVPPNTPAGKAGLRKGDRIIEINGTPIETQTDLRFALGPLYAGEGARLKVKRGEETVEANVELVGELGPFHHAFLGILPRRDGEARHAADEKKPLAADKDDTEKNADDNAGVTVRMVYPGSPAAGAGIRPGDRLTQIGDAKVANIADAIAAVNALVPESEVALHIVRDDHAIESNVVATRVPTMVPNELPAAFSAAKEAPAANANPAAPRTRELKLAEFPETCKFYIPPSYNAGHPAGMLLWIHAPGVPPDDELFQRWQAVCDRDGLMLVVPTAADPSRWERTELEYLRKLTERITNDYRIDKRRLIVAGPGAGGTMAYMLAILGRDVFTGVAATNAALPRTIKLPPNSPTTRLAVFAGLPADSARMAQVRAGLKKLADAGYPVTAITTTSEDGSLSADEQQTLARWIDTLDRF